MTTETVFLAKTVYGQVIANAVFATRAEALRWALSKGVEFPAHVIVERTVAVTERVIRRDRRAA